jgi:hypothetical protein
VIIGWALEEKFSNILGLFDLDQLASFNAAETVPLLF